MDFPNSPYAVLYELVTELHEGRRTPEAFLASLEQVDLVLEQWAEAAGGVSVPEENPEAGRMVEVTLQALQLFADAANRLRDYVDSGDEAVAEEAMGLAAQGHHALANLMAVTSDALDQIEA